MSTSDFSGPRAKVGRARHHLDEYVKRQKEYFESCPYSIERQHEVDTGDTVFRFRVSCEPPQELATVAGDVVHNLRSALDLAFCEAVLAQGHEIKRQDAFIVADSEEAFRNALRRMAGRVSHSCLALLESLKPYPSGNNELWQLHKLDIVDKHKILIAFAARHEAVGIVMTMPVPWQDDPIVSPPIHIRPADTGPLEDGYELLRASAASDFDRYQGAPSFQISLAMHVDGITQCEEVVAFLEKLCDVVEEGVERISTCVA